MVHVSVQVVSSYVTPWLSNTCLISVISFVITLYMLYTADLPASPESSTGIFADDTAVVVADSDPAIASQKLQTDSLAIQNWFKNGE
jgi:hypothetical protein